MEEHNDVRGRMGSVAALATAAVIATATAVGPVAVQHAAAPEAAVAVRQAKSLPVQLTAYNPVFPYAQPVGPLGLAITLPLAAATAVLQPVVQGATDLLTTLRLDPRLAQQPVLLTQSLVIPVAVGLQTALASALDGTYVYGRFTPIQAINFFVDRLKTAIETTIAAQRALFGLPAVTARTPERSSSTEDVAAPEVVEESETVTLSTVQDDDPARMRALSAAPAEAAETETSGTPTEPETDDATESLDVEDEITEETPGVKRPRFTLPTLKLPTFKLPTLKTRTPQSESASDDDATDADGSSSTGASGGDATDSGSDGSAGGGAAAE